ncbi:hypothetical protein AB7C87_05000 [Natrarchaeobius sp. A-rgal3]|uniref:hypothetical protein n=1 Tax=Natrarchaeobius versutus TaxID=1679078 RepID=UPI00350F8159
MGSKRTLERWRTSSTAAKPVESRRAGKATPDTQTGASARSPEVTSRVDDTKAVTTAPKGAATGRTADGSDTPTPPNTGIDPTGTSSSTPADAPKRSGGGARNRVDTVGSPESIARNPGSTATTEVNGHGMSDESTLEDDENRAIDRIGIDADAKGRSRLESAGVAVAVSPEVATAAETNDGERDGNSVTKGADSGAKPTTNSGAKATTNNEGEAARISAVDERDDGSRTNRTSAVTDPTAAATDTNRNNRRTVATSAEKATRNRKAEVEKRWADETRTNTGDEDRTNTGNEDSNGTIDASTVVATTVAPGGKKRGDADSAGASRTGAETSHRDAVLTPIASIGIDGNTGPTAANSADTEPTTTNSADTEPTTTNADRPGRLVETIPVAGTSAPVSGATRRTLEQDASNPKTTPVADSATSNGVVEPNTATGPRGPTRKNAERAGNDGVTRR